MAGADEGVWSLSGFPPKLYLVSRPSMNADAVAEFLKDVGLTWRRSSTASPSEELVELAGRVCYLSLGEKQSERTNTAYIANLIQRKHESVLEHATWSFLLSGVSRAFTHQLVRHRVGFSFSQLSQQYHDESEATFLVPSAIREDASLLRIWSRSTEEALRSYREIVESLEGGASQGEVTASEKTRRVRSAARSLLPEGTSTTIFITANARSLRHFLSVRGAIEGDEEMRITSTLILRAMSREAPSMFSDFREEDLGGLPIVRNIAQRS